MDPLVSPPSGSASPPASSVVPQSIKLPKINYQQNSNSQNYYAGTLNAFQQNSSVLLGMAVILMVVGLILIKSGK